MKVEKQTKVPKNLLELSASQMEKRTEIAIRRAGSPVA